VSITHKLFRISFRDIVKRVTKFTLSLAQLPCPALVTSEIPRYRDARRCGKLGQSEASHGVGSTEQDFPDLGIELKTIPVDPQGRPLETTFVCVAPLIGVSGQRWEESNVRNKLSRVLWIPVEGSRDIPVGDRRVGMPLLWSPNEEEEGLLRQDWEELMDMIVLGEVEQISARHGQVLQLRPKAANSKALTRAIGRNGQPIMTLPRGFYLKIEFTHQLLQRHFALPL
jgi:DNA mismatch repair protein MutH